MECVRVLTLVCVFVAYAAALRIPQKRWAVDDSGCRTPGGGVGNCIRISECQTMIDYLSKKTNLTENEQNVLFYYRCGMYKGEPKVCCPSEPINLGWVVDSDRCRLPDKSEDSFCMNIEECKILYEYIDKNTITDSIVKTISKYRCSSSSVKVCCPSKLPNILISPRIADDVQHPNAKLLPENCGEIYTGEKIINGNKTVLLEYPWAAVLKYDKPINAWGCGGSLINDRYVLTAAHCIRSKNRLIAVRLGEHDFKTNPDCFPAQPSECAEVPQDFEVSTEDAIVHPQYDTNTYSNDIALIRLRKPANMSVYSVAPICLPLTKEQKDHNFSNYTVIGWGATESGYASSILLKVVIPKVDNAECALKYASGISVTDNQLCVGGRNQQDSCLGDSGGPLMGDSRVRSNIKTIQYGIVSLGPRICGREEFPAVYTRVDKYTRWILDSIEP